MHGRGNMIIVEERGNMGRLKELRGYVDQKLENMEDIGKRNGAIKIFCSGTS